ncbi:putative ribonuclease H-like domain-containing protein [Tanacetum coccineum]
MTGNMSYLSDFKEFDRGYVTFGGGAKEEKLLVKEFLKLMCDKKNSVLFTDTGCFVLSPDFKLADESQVLLKVPRKNNMYSVDMKNIVPKECLTCLVAKATLDESMLWHRRLGHVKFKTINKFVKENLVRGLLTKRFENDKTRVACLKRKQHKASCIKREFSVARTPQQNGVAERSNRTLIETARTMLADSKLPTTLWAEAVNTACYVCHVTILNTLDYLGKFDGKSDEGFYVGYSMNSDGPKCLFDIDVLKKSMNYVLVIACTNSNNLVGTKESIDAGHSSKEMGSSQEYILMPLWKDVSLFDSSSKNVSNDEPKPFSDAGNKDDEGDNATLEATHTDFFGDETESGVLTRRMTKTTNEQGFVSVVYEGKIHEDLHTCLFAYFFIPRRAQKGNPSIKRSKLDKSYTKRDYAVQVTTGLDLDGFATWQKSHCCTGLHSRRGIDYDEVFAPVARIKAIRLFLAYASFKDFVVCQMDVKSAFLYGKIKEEVYVCQPLGFEDLEFPDRVYKRGQIDKTLFIKRVKSDILLVHVYVDDIIFGSTKKMLCTEFKKLMHKKFQMSSMGELTFFLRLQVTQKNDGIFISQDKYVDEILKKFSFSTVKTVSTPMETSKSLLKDAEAEDVDVYLYRSVIGSLIIFRYLKGQPKLGLWYPKDSPFNLEAFSDSDYAGASLDRKSTTGGCQFLGSRLILWQCKKQTIVVNSTTKAEYVVASSCYGQVLWIQN